MVQVFVLIGLWFVIETYFGMKEGETYDLRNVPFVIAFLLLLGWCLIPRPLKSVSEDAARNKITFRLGKALNRILCRWR